MGRGRRTVTVHHVRAALRGAQRLGLDTVPLLQRARIPPLLLTDDRARVSPEQFARLVRALHRATGDEFLGDRGDHPLAAPAPVAMSCRLAVLRTWAPAPRTAPSTSTRAWWTS
ncbi:hypothetical protein SANTM175S_03438 [Streptomyces antimycoticus]